MMKILKNKTAKNALWLIFEKIFNMSISLVTLALIARYLGPEKYGMLTYAIAFVALFAIFSTLGLDSVNVKSIVQKEAKEGTILFTSLCMRLIGSIIIIVLSLVAIIVTGIEDKTQIILIIMMSGVYIFRSLEVIEYWIQAYQNARLSSLVRMVVAFISAVLKVCVVYLDLGILLLGFIYIIDVILIGLGLIFVYMKFREQKSKWKFSFEYVKSALSQSWYLIISGILVTCYTQLDKVFLGNLASKEDLGIYMAALAVSSLWIFIPQALINSFKPVIMRLKTLDEKAYIIKIQQMYSTLMVINIICAIMVFLFSDLIIAILYGEKYGAASNLLTITVWAGCFSVLGTARGIWMLCEGIQKYSIFYLGFGAVFSIAMNLILIPKFGPLGAAITILCTEILTTIIAPMFFLETRLFSKMFFKAILLKNLKG
ncbi:MAG: flippase [Solibacillus sp.]